MTYDATEAARLVAEMREDDARMTRWPATHIENSRNAAALARLRNNAKPLADQLEAAMAEVERLTAIVDLARAWRRNGSGAGDTLRLVAAVDACHAGKP